VENRLGPRDSDPAAVCSDIVPILIIVDLKGSIDLALGAGALRLKDIGFA
jgi:hypothetical protein